MAKIGGESTADQLPLFFARAHADTRLYLLVALVVVVFLERREGNYPFPLPTEYR